MNDKRIETYLRKSTRGVWGQKKADVREEFFSHIEGRVHGHLVAGLSESDAIEKTMTELG
ncbi:MAG: permease prefix domain 1-containing protein [Trueperaceae bacterium]